MAPSIQAQHVVAVTIPTIAVLFFTYLWYKKRSNSITRSRNDPGGGGATSRKRTRHRNSNSATTATHVASASSAAAHIVNSSNSLSGVSISTTHVEPRETLPEPLKNAFQKMVRDLETASPIQEVCSDAEESQTREVGESDSQTVVTSEQVLEEVDTATTNPGETQKLSVPSSANVTNDDDDADADAVAVAVVENEDSDETGDSALSWADEESTKSTCVSPVTSPKSDASVDERKRRSESEKNGKTGNGSSGSTCCISSRQFDCKSGIKNEESDVADNLDVAMQKLESLRVLSDSKSQSKRKQNGDNNVKRQSPTTTTSTSKDTAKSPPTSPLSQLATSPSSRARKRRSKRRLKAMQPDTVVYIGAAAADDGDSCKSSGSETTVQATITTTAKMAAAATCDSNTNANIDVCGSRTNNKEANQHGTRKWTTDYTTRENDRISCSKGLKVPHNCDLKVIENHKKDCDNERDSANHSPIDTSLDCQSVQFSDAHSEGSSDSGKGCSEGAVSPSARTPAGGSSISGDQNTIVLYQFVIPQEHVGKLIGKQGQFINAIKNNSNTKIFIKKHPTSSFKKKICALEGTQPDINKALELIRVRFPEETYPDLTLEEFPLAHQPLACGPLRTELYRLDLVEGVNNDVVISSVVTAGQLFLQQPMHPSHQSLNLLNVNMNHVYNSPEAPVVQKPAKDMVVAAPAMGGWYRAQISTVDEEAETCEVRFLDYGGYLTLSTSSLRAIRADLMTLPFQAVECFLANIAPINDTWCEDARIVLHSMTYGKILQAQVYDYTPEGIPLILLYVVIGNQVIFINDELVARGYAYATVPYDGAQFEDYYSYS